MSENRQPVAELLLEGEDARIAHLRVHLEVLGRDLLLANRSGAIFSELVVCPGTLLGHAGRRLELGLCKPEGLELPRGSRRLGGRPHRRGASHRVGHVLALSRRRGSLRPWAVGPRTIAPSL